MMNSLRLQKIAIIIIIFFLNIGCLFAGLANPAQSIENHLENLQSKNYNPATSALSLNIANPTSDRGKELALKLKQILDGKKLYVILENVPTDAFYIDSSTGEHIYLLFNEEPRIYLEKVGKRWLYSAETVGLIEQLYSETYPYGVDSFIYSLDGFWQYSLFEVKIWQWIGVVIYIITGFILFYIFRLIFRHIIITTLRRFGKGQIANNYIRPISAPASVQMVMFLFILFLPLLHLPINAVLFFDYIYKAIAPILLVYLLIKAANLVFYFLYKITEKTETDMDDNIVSLLHSVIKGVIVILGLFVILKNFDVDITPVIAGASIGGLALALAAQDTVKNLFGSVTIFSDRPFKVGDWIVFDNAEGVVEEVKIRSTRVRTFYNSVISIPNGRLADLRIDNMGRREFRRFRTIIGIKYDTPPELIEAYVDGLREIVLQMVQTRKEVIEIHLNDFDASSLNILVYIFFKVSNWTEELKCRQEFMIKSIKLAHTLGVEFAFPTQTLHIENFPEKKTMSASYETRPEIIEERKKRFFGD